MHDRVRAFLERNHGAAMVTLRVDGTPHVARVGVGLVDGTLLSSGTRGRLRTRHLRRDPRSTLMVFDAQWSWLGLETVVTIHEGPDAPARNLALYRAIAGEPDDVDEYLEAMVLEERLVYEFDIRRVYGTY